MKTNNSRKAVLFSVLTLLLFSILLTVALGYLNYKRSVDASLTDQFVFKKITALETNIADTYFDIRKHSISLTRVNNLVNITLTNLTFTTNTNQISNFESFLNNIYGNVTNLAITANISSTYDIHGATITESSNRIDITTLTDLTGFSTIFDVTDNDFGFSHTIPIRSAQTNISITAAYNGGNLTVEEPSLFVFVDDDEEEPVLRAVAVDYDDGDFFIDRFPSGFNISGGNYTNTSTSQGALSTIVPKLELAFKTPETFRITMGDLSIGTILGIKREGPILLANK